MDPGMLLLHCHHRFHDGIRLYGGADGSMARCSRNIHHIAVDGMVRMRAWRRRLHRPSHPDGMVWMGAWHDVAWSHHWHAASSDGAIGGPNPITSMFLFWR
jgi:hypothetical protein